MPAEDEGAEEAGVRAEIDHPPGARRPFKRPFHLGGKRVVTEAEDLLEGVHVRCPVPQVHGEARLPQVVSRRSLATSERVGEETRPLPHEVRESGRGPQSLQDAHGPRI